MNLIYAIDFESWAFPEREDFLCLTSEARKSLDNGYVAESGYRLLDLLEKKKQKLTFFVVSQIYEWYPQLIKDIAQAGHEIAFHNHTHRVLKNLDALKGELENGRDFAADFKIKGYRSPAMVFPPHGHSLLKQFGFEYSSSIYSGSNEIFQIDQIKEIPVSVFNYSDAVEEVEINLPMSMSISMLARGIPVGSSLFTAILGGRLTADLIKKMERRGYNFANLFIHNWQIFPPENATFPDRKFLIRNPLYLPYTRNIKKDFEYLLDRFRFCRFSDFLNS